MEDFIESKSTEDDIKKLPKDPKTSENYLYAYYPKENPASYHLGAVLYPKGSSLNGGGADFNSKAAGYVNGFDGRGQVFDIHYK